MAGAPQEPAGQGPARQQPAAQDPSAQELLRFAVQLVRLGGAMVQAGRADAVRGEVGAKSTPTDVVTVMDRACERLVVDRLVATRPDDGVLGEEGGERTGASGIRWLLDPIDGTVNYLYGLPYSVSLAAERDGEVVAGAVYAPVSGELFTAVRGAGAMLRDAAGERTLRLGPPPELAQALVATGFGYAAERRSDQVAVVAALLPQIRDIRRLGAASLDLCAVAAGRVDAYFERGTSLWDHAAGGLVAAEAGATVSGLRGAPAGPDMVLAAAGALHGRLDSLLSGLGADSGA